jgi:teichuronic acid exporter
MTLKSKAFRAFAWVLSDKLINQFGYLIVTVYLARLIGPESFGFIAVLTIFILLAESVVSGGFASALVQRSQQLTEDDSCTVFWINCVWGLLIYIALFTAAPLIAEFYRQPELVAIARVLFLVIIINTLTIVPRAKLTIIVDFRSQAIANTIATFFSSTLAILMASNGYGYWALVWLTISKSFISSVCIWWFCPWLPKWRFSRKSFESIFSFGSNLMVASFVATVVNNLYVVLIGRFYNVTQVGFYTQAANLSSYLSQSIASSLENVAYPIMTSIKDDRDRLIGIYKQLISITMLVSLPMLTGFAAIADDAVMLFLGEEWIPTVPVLVALCIARTITPISSINMNILNAIGRSDLFLKIDLFKLPMTLGALFLALPFGIQGVAWASVCTSFIAFFINAWLPGKMFGYGGLAQLSVARPYILASALMFLIMHFVPLSASYAGIAGKITIGALIYVIFARIMGDVWIDRLWRGAANRFRRP